MIEVEVRIVLKKGVADPEGANTAKALKLLGFEDIKEVKSAKVFRIFLDADDEEKAMCRAREMCDKLLANPVVHDFDINVRSGGN
jgi:phosphoribosylformylglycinamidine synthase PurS subunit